MKPCIKEKQIEKIEAMAEKNNDCIIAIQADIGYIKDSVKSIEENHLVHLDAKIENLSSNYLVFKTKVLVGWGIALTVITSIISFLMNKYL